MTETNYVSATNQTTTPWQQAYNYDRFGNRTINGSATWGPGNPSINNLQTWTDTSNNRLYAQGDQNLALSQRLIQYDPAGNQTVDRYSPNWQGTRLYDAENRMITATDTSNNVDNYSYDADGHRVKRSVAGQPEVWQVYGLGGELLAEYAANAAPTLPQKEYGYRNGQLLITAEPPTSGAPAPSGLSAAPSSGGASIAVNWTAASGATNYKVTRSSSINGPYTFAGATLTTSFADTGVTSGTAYLYKVCAADSQNNCLSGDSNIAMGAAIAFTDPTIVPQLTTPKAQHITDLRAAVNAVRSLAGLSAANWTNPTLTPGSSVISAADINDLRTNLDQALIELGLPTSSYTDSPLATGQFGTLVKAIHITELRQRAASGSGTGGGGGGGTAVQIHWLVADQLGTPRMIFDQSGSLAGVSRHDYLPFGEELVVGQGLRTAASGYTENDGVRQQFTLKERDSETGLDYSINRYYSSTQGRFTSADPLGASAIVSDPQSFNRYTYVLNNPLKYVDSNGLDAHNPWADLTDDEKKLLAPKLTTVTGNDQMKAAQDAFNKMVTATNKDGSLNEELTDTKTASVKNFVDSLGADSKVWNQVQSVDLVTARGDGKQADINFTVKDHDAFISAVKETKDAYGYNRFIYLGTEQGHIDSTRELGYGVTDPSMHIDSGGPKSNHFGAHWDPTSFFTKDTWKEWGLDTVPGGVLRRPPAGAYHWVGPRASTEAVRQSLKEQGLVPQH